MYSVEDIPGRVTSMYPALAGSVALPCRMLKVPFLARLPGEIGAGTTCDAIVSNVDFAPTFLDLAGVPIPSYMQGRSARGTIAGQVPGDLPKEAYHRYWMHKDESHNAFAHYGLRDHRYKLIYWYNDDLDQPGAHPSVDEQPEWELFDCEKDPLELFNVYDDPAYAEVRAEMTRKLDARMLEIGDIPEHRPFGAQ